MEILLGFYLDKSPLLLDQFFTEVLSNFFWTKMLLHP